MNPGFKAIIATILSGSVTLMTAGSASIGMATASGSFNVDNSRVKNSASVLNGMRVGTDSTSSYLVLDGGSQLSLAEGSTGQVFRDRLVLERGSLRIDRANNFAIDTATVRITPADPLSKMRIVIGDQNKVLVDVLSGEARVTNLKGVEGGSGLPQAIHSRSRCLPPLDRMPQAGAASTTRIAGCVQRVTAGGKTYYILTDSTTHTRTQIEGALAEKLAGKYAEVEGSVNTTVTPVRDASQVVEVAKVDAERKENGCRVGGGGARAAGVPIWVAGVLVGGAVAGTVGGLAAASAFSSSSSAVAGNSVSTP